MTNFEKVRNFHLVFNRPVGKTPHILEGQAWSLRMSLIEEELDELYAAKTVVEYADALGDLLYVVYGTAVEAGIDIDRVFAEIHRSNMTKLGPDGKPILREDGKVMKGESFRPPDIQSALANSV